MQMMMVDSGQPSYGSATMLGSASAVFYLLQAAAALWFLWPAAAKVAAAESEEPRPCHNDSPSSFEEKLAVKL